MTVFRYLATALLCIMGLGFAAPATAQGGPPSFGKVFTPDTIGPGSTSHLRFTINNGAAPTPVTDLAFVDVLPAGVVLATPASPTTTCVNGLVAAPDGGTTITFSNGSVGASGSCTVSVLVTSATPGTHTNVSGNLTSSAGNSGTASDDLTVSTSFPGFSKSFAPSSVPLGQRSTLTFIIDNSANAAAVANLDFTDNLPSGMQIASPSNASTTCVGPLNDTTLTANPGSNSVVLDANGVAAPGFEALAAGATCSVVVDVVATGNGAQHNLSASLQANFVDAGMATAALQVSRDTLQLIKSFTDDPTPAGGTVTLQFSLTNYDRNEPATVISFTDDLSATLPGLTAVGLPLADPCGVGSSLSGSSVLTLSGATLAAGATCAFSVTLQIPSGTTPASYTNTTSNVTGTLVGHPGPFGPGSDDLFVSSAPVLTKVFTDDPVSAGSDVTLEFTITNTSATSAATDISFDDELTTFLPTPIMATLPSNPCGAGSTIAVIPMGSGGQGLQLTGGNLTPAGTAGDSCTFGVTITLPLGLSAGTYHNETGAISATVDGTTATGATAGDDLVVVAAPRLRKEFTTDPALPGDPVTLRFTLSNTREGAQDATAIAFTDDLGASLSGLVAVATPANSCAGSTVDISTPSIVAFSGGSLPADSTCSFDVTLQVPGAAVGGSYPNTTSAVSATVLGVAVASPAASNSLIVAGLTLGKQFTDDPALPGDTVTLEFTIDNTASTLDATGILFTDSLTSMLAGAAATGPMPTNPCGAGSSISGTTFLIFVGGNLTAGTSCNFSVTVQIPPAAADGNYNNVTSGMSATVGGNAVALPGASDVLAINSDLLLLQKTFTDDPVMPGGTVTLEFTVTNQDATNAVTGIAFTDDLDAALSGLVATGLPASNICGAGSQIAGTSLLSLTGGSLGAGATCTFSVTLQVPLAAGSGNVLNTTSGISGLIGGLPVSGGPASDTLRIRNIDFSKTFNGPSAASRTTQLSFTITNLDSANAVTDLGFSDDLDAVLSGLVAVGLPQSNVCGAGSQISGTGFLSLTGGSLPASGSCTFAVTVQVPAAAMAGSYPNVTSDLLSGGLAVATPATANLTVEPPPTFAKAFAPATIGAGQLSTLTFTVDNSASSLAATALDFTDNLPAGLTVAATPNAVSTCIGGTLSASAGSGIISYSGGSVAAGSSCTLSVDTTAAVDGMYSNTSGDLTSSNGNSGSASDTLTVIAQPGFSKAFAPASIAAGSASTLTFSIDNSAGTVGLTSLAFVDNLPAGMTVAAPANASTTCSGGSLTATSGSSTLQYSGGSLAAGASCTVQANVTAATAGDYANTSGALLSNLGTAGMASDTLTVLSAPVFSKTFSPASIAIGATSTLTFGIDNSANSVAATALDFSDSLPAGLVVATPANASTTCTGGTLSAAAGSASISYTGGTAVAGGSCTVQVEVEAQAQGTLVNTSGDLTSSAGNSGPANATLTVSGADIAISKTFQTDPVLRGAQVVIRYTINNLSPSAAVDSVAFSDDFNAVISGWSAVGLPLANGCGAGSSVGGAGVISLSGGSIPASGSCTFDVTLQLPGNAPLGPVTSTSSAVTGSVFGNPITGNTASDDLTLTWLAFSKAFVVSGAPIPGGDIGLMFTINNPDSNNAVSAISFSDDLDAAVPGMFANGLPTSGVCGGGSQVSGSSLVTLSNGSIPAGGSCSFQISVHVPNSVIAGNYTNNTSPLSATPAGGVAASGDPGDVANASIALPNGVPSALTEPDLIPTLDLRWLLALVGLFGLIAGYTLRPR